jgi:hypothetical protein
MNNPGRTSANLIGWAQDESNCVLQKRYPESAIPNQPKILITLKLVVDQILREVKSEQNQVWVSVLAKSAAGVSAIPRSGTAEGRPQSGGAAFRKPIPESTSRLAACVIPDG